MSPIPTRQFSKGRTGVANVVVTTSKIQVTFEDNNQTVTILPEDAPPYIKEGRQVITLNSSNTEIFGARPIGGTHRVVFAGFAAREGEPPIIREVEARSGVSKNGRKYFIKEHLEYTALFDVTAGKWKGYRIIYNLPYNFEPYKEGVDSDPITLIYGGKVSEFLEVCGMDFDKDTIPWSENVLVPIEKLLKARQRPVAISLTDQGWVKDIGAIPVDDTEEEEVTVTSTPEPKTGAVTMSAEQAADDLYGAEPKKKPEAPTILSLLYTQAKAGDESALSMLKALADSNAEASKLYDTL